VEALLDHRRIASYPRSYGPKGSATTIEEHRPKSHRDYGAWPPSRLVSWASSVGPRTGEVVAQILRDRPHPEQGFRACLALIRESKKYGSARTEAACARAIAIGSPTRKSVGMILKRGLDRLPLVETRTDAKDPQQQRSLPLQHENVRGGDYFDTEPRTRPKGDPSGDGTGTMH
jgi:transposase